MMITDDTDYVFTAIILSNKQKDCILNTHVPVKL